MDSDIDTPELFSFEESIDNGHNEAAGHNGTNGFANNAMDQEEENDVEQEEEIQLTPAQVIELMLEAWRNEKFAPEILPNRSEVVDCLLGQITYMQDNLENLDKKDFKRGIHQLELDKLKFLVTSYLRTRLMKIEMYVFHILKQETERASKGEELYLTENELKYARNYKQSLEQQLENVVSFDPSLPLDQWKNTPIEPNTKTFVFSKSKTEIEGVVISDLNGEDGDLVDLNRESRTLISYHSIANLVKKGDVLLI